MTTQTTISVLLPAYNASNLIVDALNSVLEQTHAADEIIVINDGSTDNTEDVVRQWSREHCPQLRLLSKSNGGTASARNLGISHASSKLIALLDADDLLLPSHLERFIQIFDRSPNSVLAFSDAVREINGEDDGRNFLLGTALTQLPFRELGDGVRLIQKSAYSGIIQGSRIATCSCVFNRESAVALNAFNEKLRYSEDRDFFLRLSKKGTFAYVTESLSVVRIHGENKESLKNRGEVRRGRARMLAALVEESKHLELTDIEMQMTNQELANSIQKAFYWSALDGLSRYRDWCQEARAINPEIRGGVRNYLRALLHTIVG